MNASDRDDTNGGSAEPDSDRPSHSAPTLPPPIDGFAARSLAGTTDTVTLPPAQDSTASDSLGPLPVLPGYEILAELGRGGMGVVFKARQLKLNRIVALKMILAGRYASRDDLIRFLAEAEAVAQLQHSNVIQIFEIGTQAGLPWFSLEFADGGSLADKVRVNPLPPIEAAVLVEQIAKGVQAAHDRGIIHRDLKPDNVLLTSLGVPKVTDFGLAKRIDGGSGLTHTGALMGTPSYMAPEQAEGGTNIGVAADVYALGGILYRLLTGRPPFQAANALDTIVQVVGEEPVAPSRLQAKLPRDLETICLKCLRKEPERRYASAAEMANDLRRFLDGRPILARPTGKIETAMKWARRRPAAAALIVVIAVATIVFAGAGAWFNYKLRVERNDARNGWFEADRQTAIARTQATEADRQRDRAQQSYTIARTALDQCLEKLRQDPRFQQGEMEDLRVTLEKVEMEFYKQFTGLHGDEASFRAERGKALERLAEVTFRLSGAADAIAPAKEAKMVFEKLAAEKPNDRGYVEHLMRVVNLLSILYSNSGRSDDARAALDQILERLTAEATRHPDDPDWQDSLAGAHCNIANWLESVNRLADAIPHARQAIELERAVIAAHPDPEFRKSLGVQCRRLGMLFSYQGAAQQAKAPFEEAVRVLRELFKEIPQDETVVDELAKALNSLSVCNYDLGHLDAAATLIDEAIKLKSKLTALHPKVPEYRLSLATSLNSQGTLALDTNQPKLAETAFRRSADFLEQQLKEAYSEREAGMLGGVYCNLGLLYQKTEPKTAIDWFCKSVTCLTDLSKRPGPKHPVVKQFLFNALEGRAATYMILQNYAEALTDFGAALPIAPPPSRTQILFARARCQAFTGKHAEARAFVGNLRDGKDLPPLFVYLAGCVLAQSGKAAEQDASLDTKQRERLAKQDYAAALTWLKRAQQAGYFGSAEERADLDSIPDLKPLRGDPEYHKWRESLPPLK